MKTKIIGKQNYIKTQCVVETEINENYVKDAIVSIILKKSYDKIVLIINSKKK